MTTTAAPTALVTVSGAVSRPAVHEIEYGTTLDEMATVAGTAGPAAGAVLDGGYFGGWASLDEVRDRPLDPAEHREDRPAFGFGVVSFLASDACGVRATAEIMTFMAGQSAAQRGPCVFGLAAIAEATQRLVIGASREDDLGRLERWANKVQGHGACSRAVGACPVLALRLQHVPDTGRLAGHRLRVGAPS